MRQNELDFMQNKKLNSHIKEKKKVTHLWTGVPVVYEHRQAGSRGAGFQFALVMCAPF